MATDIVKVSVKAVKVDGLKVKCDLCPAFVKYVRLIVKRSKNKYIYSIYCLCDEHGKKSIKK